MSFQVGESFINCCFDDKSQTWSLTVNSTVSFKLHIKRYILALLMSRTRRLQCYIHGDEAIQVLRKGHSLHRSNAHDVFIPEQLIFLLWRLLYTFMQLWYHEDII